MIIDALENAQDSWANLFSSSALAIGPLILMVLAVWVLNVPLDVAAIVAGIWLIILTFLNFYNVL